MELLGMRGDNDESDELNIRNTRGGSSLESTSDEQTPASTSEADVPPEKWIFHRKLGT
jgi:hypothetical protein